MMEITSADSQNLLWGQKKKYGKDLWEDSQWNEMKWIYPVILYIKYLTHSKHLYYWNAYIPQKII